MRIVLLNWANIADGASHGGGVNGYCRQLAIELVRRGHEVCWLYSGLSYAAAPLAGAIPPPQVRRHDDHHGVRVFEIVNSPVVAPGVFQCRDPLAEVSSPALEREVTRLFHLLSPEVVHFHNVEGFSAGCIDAAKTAGPGAPGAKVVFSLHNYHTVCPQVYLMRKGLYPCRDFDAGHACVGCLSGEPPLHEMRRRAGLPAEEPPPLPPPEPPPPFMLRAARAIKRRLLRPVPLPMIDPVLPGRPVYAAEDVAAGEAVEIVAEGPGRFTLQGLPFESEEWRPLTNEFRPPALASRALNEYGRRRRAFVETLSRCDRVLAVSGFVRGVFQKLGVQDRVLETMAIGSRMVEMAAQSPELCEPPPPFSPARPIRLAFMGYNNYFKGLPMLLDTLELLAPEYLAKFHLYIWAKDIEHDAERLQRFEGRLAGLTVRGQYRYQDVPAMLCGKDAGLVPSVWWDNGPQTVMEFLACGVPVIGAAVGGIPELVRHQHNGLLFTGNDRFGLAALLAGIARDPSVLHALRSNITAPKTMAAHAAEMESLYLRLISERE